MATSNRLRRDNVIRILEALWRRSNRSRADLARDLRLDRSTVGIIADRLLASGLIREAPYRKTGSRGGRPPVQLRIAPGTAYTIGVELTAPHVRLVAIDLAGEQLEAVDLPIDSYGPDAVHAPAAAITELRTRVDRRYSSLLGLVAAGIGVSGLVSRDAASIELSYALHIDSPLSLKDPLAAILGVPILLLNDAQATALGEAERSGTDLLLALVEFRPTDATDDVGVGIGLVLDDTLIPGYAISHLLRPQGAGEADTGRFIDHLGRSLALVANTIGVDDVVLGGDVERAGIYPDLERSIIDHCTRSGVDTFRNITVRPVSGGSNAIARGAAGAAFRHLFRTRTFPLPTIGLTAVDS